MRHTIISFLREALGRRRLLTGSAVVAGATAASYLLGLLRDRMLAQHFGATHILDAYNAAFLAPDLILNIFVAGALTAAFVPIFSDLRANPEQRNTFTDSVLNASLLTVIVAGCIVFALAPWLSHYIVPGFDTEARTLFVGLMRLLLISPIIFAISNTLGSILVTEERFTWYSISAILYNAGTIAGIIWLAPQYGMYGVALGTLCGAVAHLISRLVGMRHLIYHWRPHIVFNGSWRRFIRLMVPKMIGQPVEQFMMLGFTMIASTISAGSVTVLNFAHNFQSMPINMIGITLALTAFPGLAKAAAAGDAKEFRTHLRFVSFLILGCAAIAAIVLYLIRTPLISILFGGGAFTPEAVQATAMALGIFALAIPTESWSQILARGFYSMQNSVTPVVMSVIHLAIALGVSKFLLSFFSIPPQFGVNVLAFGFFLGSCVKTISLALLIQNETRRWFNHNRKPTSPVEAGTTSEIEI